MCLVWQERKGLFEISKGKEKVYTQNMIMSIHMEMLGFGDHDWWEKVAHNIHKFMSFWGVLNSVK